MKKFLYLVLFGSLFISCDKEAIYYFYVENNCNDSIDVIITNYLDIQSTVAISPKSKELVYTGDGLQKVTDKKVESVFKEIKIIKDTITSNKDYVNKDIWEFNAISDGVAELTLVVDSTDFVKLE